MVGPSHKKAAVSHIVGKRICSVRRACRYVGMPRSTYDYLPKPAPPHQEQLHQRIMALSWAHPRYGYRRIRVLLGREGWMVSRKHVQHIRRQEGLKVRPKPQKIPRRGYLPVCPPRRDIATMYGVGISSSIGPTRGAR